MRDPLSITLISVSLLSGCATPLYYAARRGDNAKVQKLLAKGANPNSGGFTLLYQVRTPLKNAVLGGHYAVAQTLLKAGADPNAFEYYGDKILHAACLSGNVEMVRLLLDHGANIEDLAFQHALPPLAAAALGGSEAVMQLLVDRGANQDAAVSALQTRAASWRSERFRKIDLDGAGTLQEFLTSKRIAAATTAAVEAAVQAAGVRPAPPPGGPEDVSPRYRRPEDPDAFALVVGIGEYSELPPAQFAEKDAGSVAEHMLALGVPQRNIIQLSGVKATRTGLEKYLESWLPRNVKPASRVYLYFSGHGAPDPETGKAYLVPFDGDPNFLKDTAYPLDRLYSKLAALQAKEVVVALDACFSGAGGRSVLAEGARPLVLQAAQIKPPSDKISVLTAAAGSEITSTLKREEHGIFTFFLLKGLNQEGGRVTAKSLYEYLLPKVQDEARRQNREQTPTLLLPSGMDPVLRAD